MFHPTSTIRLDGTPTNEAAVTALRISQSLSTPASEAALTFAQPVQPKSSTDVSVEIELGYQGNGQTQVFAGMVSEVERALKTTEVRALGSLQRLLKLRVDESFTAMSAGQIVQGLADRAAIPVETVDDGIELPIYVAHSELNAYQHIRRLADICGFDVYANPQGRLVFKRFRRERTHVFAYGQHVLQLANEQTPSVADQVQVFGESPAEKARDTNASWLTKEFPAAEAGSEGLVTVIENPVLRTPDLAASSAAAIAHRISQRTSIGKIRAIGRAEVALGDAIEVTGAPEVSQNGLFQIRAIHHRLSRKTGFITHIEFWSLGGTE